jgi:hypothetical protein
MRNTAGKMYDETFSTAFSSFAKGIEAEYKP